MKLIIGLGNPKDKYDGTRHNLGFTVVEQLLKDYEPVNKTNWTKEEKVKSDIVRFDWQPKEGTAIPVILAKPLTYMNNSGMGVSLLAQYYKVLPEDIWIVHDELDLPLGTMKIRFGGAAAGHHGVESVIAALNTDKFWRFRLGIGESHGYVEAGREMHNVDQYVLGKFNHEQHGRISELVHHASKAMQFALENDLAAAMNKYNTK